MKECLTEFEELQEALKKVDMDYDVMPFVRGRLCESESYNKIKKILGTPELIKSHKWCLNLDPEQLSEDEIDKIDKIYKLGLDRGFIEAPEEDSVEAIDVEEPTEECPDCAAPVVAPVQSTFKAKIPCWTVLYSAMKNGEIKTGECFSNACDPRAAKADCYAKLTRFGYENISILALEAGDPDACGCEETFETEKVEEDDMLKGREHNLHVAEEEEVKEEAEELDESGNPYAKGMKTCNIDGVSSVSTKPAKAKKASAKKALKEEDDEESSEEETSEETSSEETSSDSEETSSEETSEETTEETSEETSDEETADDSTETEETSEETSEESADEETSEETSDEESSDEDGSEETTDEETSDEDSGDTEASDDDASDEETSDEEDSEETADSDEDDSEEGSDEKKEDLTDEEKTQMKNEYKKTFKSTMEKCKFEDKCFDDLTIEEKVKFFTALQKAWKKNEPQDFMSDKEVEQLNKTVIEK